MTDQTEIIRLLCLSGYISSGLALYGHAVPYNHAYWKRCDNPQVGDLVIEQSSLMYLFKEGTERDPMDQIGTLVKIEKRPHITEDGVEVMYGPYYIIEKFDGSTIEWSNANFIAVPRTAKEYLEWREPK